VAEVTNFLGADTKSLARFAKLRHFAPPRIAVRLSHRNRSDTPLLLLLALVSATVSALTAMLFHAVTAWLGAAARGPWLSTHRAVLIIIPALAGLLIAALLAWVFPAMGGPGVNQTKAAIYVNSGRMALRAALGKLLTSALAIGGGYSLGPEDPMLHFGAAVASVIGRKARLAPETQRLMAPIGAVAGLAGAFNAPISAVLFVIEEITGGWTARSLGAAIFAASASVIISRLLPATGPLFLIPPLGVLAPAELLHGVAIGVVGGLAAVLFSRQLGYLRSRLRALPRWTRYVQPAGAGLLIGLLAYCGAPQIMGAGYGVVDGIAAGQFAWQVLATLAVLKILATTLSVASGTPGGLFAPTLVIGAMLGGAMGGAAQTLWPGAPTVVITDALIGMSALFAGFLRVPITAATIAVEVSGQYSIIVPAMLASACAYLISRRFQSTPIFDLLGRQDGLRLPSMEQERETVILRVEHAMDPPPSIVLTGRQTVAEALNTMNGFGETHVLLRDETLGWRVLGQDWLRVAAKLGKSDVPLTSICPEDAPPRIYPDRPLHSVFSHLHAWPLLPVLHRTDPVRLEGILTLAAALRRCEADTAGPADRND
jgi:chloride channel protein, CIC family